MLLEIKDVSKEYSSGLLRSRTVRAVDHVSFTVREGEIVGLIGESGCGKSTLTKLMLGLMKPSGGEILYNEKTSLTQLPQRKWKPLRKEIQCVFQHPQMTFNPQRNLYFSCAEPLRQFHIRPENGEKEFIRCMTERMGIPFDQLKKFPHEISGGQAQRISIARALSLKPRLLICDEATSMLDVSVQAQILQLLLKQNREHHTAMLFISHDLEVIEYMCSRIVVMKNGKVVEKGNTSEVFKNPQHEYTKKLLQAKIDL